MAGSEPRATVLVVDDEPDVADAYALRLEGEYDVRTAYGGEAALETIDDAVDVVLLDRRMPDRSGDDVLDEIRERGYDCGIIMVTAVDPDFEIIDLPFDDYLCKPVERETLFDAIDEQIDAIEKDEAVSELFSVTAKAGVLEQRKPAEELEAHPEYQQLRERARELRQQIHGDGADGSVDGAPAGPEDGVADDDAGGSAEASEPVRTDEENDATGREASESDTVGSPGLLGRIRGLFGI